MLASNSWKRKRNSGEKIKRDSTSHLKSPSPKWVLVLAEEDMLRGGKTPFRRQPILRNTNKDIKNGIFALTSLLDQHHQIHVENQISMEWITSESIQIWCATYTQCDKDLEKTLSYSFIRDFSAYLADTKTGHHEPWPTTGNILNGIPVRMHSKVQCIKLSWI